MQLIFYMQIKYESLLQTETKVFDGYVQAFPKFPKKQVCNVFIISLKT